jgi:Tfp pilus assembly protein PilX
MKIQPSIISRRGRERGSAVLVLLILLVIMTLLAAANSSALLHLRREVNLLEHRQVVRLNSTPTNAAPTAASPALPESR